MLALDVLDADPSEFMNLAAAHRITDFNPATDQLALIAPEATIDDPVFIGWNATTNVTTISLSEYLRLEIAGVNGETTPIGIDFYTSQAALTAGTPFCSV